MISIAETASKKIGTLIHSMKFLSLLFISVDILDSHIWNTVVMPQVATPS